MSSVRSQDQIEARERDILGRLPFQAQHVPNSQTHDFDARLTAPFVGTDLIRIAGRVRVEAGTPVELKTAQVWISDNGSGKGRRRGTWQVSRSTHQKLVKIDGIYALIIQDGEEILAGLLLEADELEEFVTSWTNGGRTAGATTSHQRAHVSWAKVIPPAKVKGGGVCPC